MPAPKTLSENLEDYLEVILELERTNKVARAKDIAERMNVKRASVTGALKSLDKKGLINYEPYSYITLTPAGTKIAKKVFHHHSVLKDFLINILLIETKEADETACRMEHAITEKAIKRLVKFVDFINQTHESDPDWLQSFFKKL